MRELADAITSLRLGQTTEFWHIYDLEKKLAQHKKAKQDIELEMIPLLQLQAELLSCEGFNDWGLPDGMTPAHFAAYVERTQAGQS